MSNILDKLINAVHKDDAKEIYQCFDVIESLGENSRRLLDIGIVQDELVKLGFTQSKFYPMHFQKKYFFIRFDSEDCIVISWAKSIDDENHKVIFNYKSSTWKEDLIEYVKGLIK